MYVVLWGAMENASIDAVAWIQRAGIDSTLGPTLPLPLPLPLPLLDLLALRLSCSCCSGFCSATRTLGAVWQSRAWAVAVAQAWT